MRRLAEKLGGRYVPEPFEVHTFKRAVYRAVSKTQDRRHRSRGNVRESHTRQVRRMIVLHAKQAQAAVMAAVLRTELQASCDVAVTPRDVNMLLDSVDPPGADCLIADPALLMNTEDGADLARLLARRGIPVIPLASLDNMDMSSADRWRGTSRRGSARR